MSSLSHRTITGALCGLVGLVWCICAAGGVFAAGPATAAPPSEVDRALADLMSEAPSVQEAAIQKLSASDDPNVLPKLEDLQANADRSMRVLLKPIVDLHKNRIKLTA
ncbi:MAG: hypothetical protein C4293_20450, partial [Nitrospiraceae bacterium]